MSVLSDSAKAYAQTEGLYVFPLKEHGKTPLTAHGLEDATTDALTIETWWGRWPDANIAIRTGDLVVVDEDHPGALLELAERQHQQLPQTRIARTGKGRHYYFTQPQGQRIRNTAGKLAPGVDTRGDGGYVVAPPSIHPSGAVYTWEAECDPAPFPAWLAEQLTTPQPERTPLPDLAAAPGTTPYGQRALEQELASVALAAEGTRNHTLNTAAFALGQLVAGGEIDSYDAQRSLEAAAQACGLPLIEAHRTIQSGFRAGLAEPRRAPETNILKSMDAPGSPPTSAAAKELAESPIIFETLRSFLKRDVPPSESLVGVTRDGTNLLPRYGWVMPWGREGSGKTSILVDLIFHACSGIDWLGHNVSRPLKIVAVVNEGVPGGLQDKLRQKTERWEHSDIVLDNLAVYASPWGEFTFKNERMVAHAKDFARDFQADYIALDPLHTLGTTGVGSPVETEEFKHMLRDFGLWDWIGVITAHHSNKAGMLSGDWGRHPDTVIQVEKDGKQPATKFTITKARPADPKELGVPCLLEWVIDTLGYTRHDLKAAAAFNEEEGLAKAQEALAGAVTPLGKEALAKAVGQTLEHARDAVARWIANGQILDLTPEKRSFKLVLPSSVAPSPTQSDATSDELHQTRMVEPHSYVDATATNSDEGQDSPEGASYVVRRPPFREGDVTDETERADEPGNELEWR